MVSSTSLLFLLSAISSTTFAQCFWPAGNAAPDMVPCATGSTCCSSADMCLTNGLCRIGSDSSAVQFARGACTDSSWGSGCLQQCSKQSHPGSYITNLAAIFLCSGNGPSDPAGASYCCETAIGQKTGCCSGTTFNLPQGAAAAKPKPAVFLQGTSSSSSAAATTTTTSKTSSSTTSCTSTYSALSSAAGNSTSYSTATVSGSPSVSLNGTLASASPTAPAATPTGAAARLSFGLAGVIAVAGSMVILL